METNRSDNTFGEPPVVVAKLVSAYSKGVVQESFAIAVSNSSQPEPDHDELLRSGVCSSTLPGRKLLVRSFFDPTREDGSRPEASDFEGGGSKLSMPISIGCILDLDVTKGDPSKADVHVKTQQQPAAFSAGKAFQPLPPRMSQRGTGGNRKI